MSDLLLPRYKLIASYPMCYHNVGYIFVMPNFQNEFTKSDWLAGLDKYPHLFKPLQWWEERKVEEMPEYIKYWDTSLYFPVDRVCKLSEAPFTDTWTSDNFQPATLEEYEAYTASTREHKEGGGDEAIC